MPRRSGRLRGALAATAAALTVATLAPVATAAPGAEQPQVFDVTAPGQDVAALAKRLADKGFDVVSRKGGEVQVLGTERTRGELAAEGAAVVRSAPGPAPVVAAAAYPKPKLLADKDYPTHYGGYRTVEGFHSFTRDVAAAYPSLVRRVEYGDSWKKAQDPGAGNSLEALCITANAANGCKTDPNSAKPRFLLMAQIHARELTTSEMAWRYITKLVDGYADDADVTSVLDGTEIWVVPQVNPDGIQWVESGLKGETGAASNSWQRKNVNNTNGAEPCRGNSGSQFGIDLNRNWDSNWGKAGTSTGTCNQVYKGPKAASEPEVSQLATLFAKLFQDQRGPAPTDPAPVTTRGAMITLHTYSNLVLFPWGYDGNVKAPNDSGLRSMAFRMNHYNGYDAGQPGEVLYDASGTTDDWAYDKLGIASFTYEIGPPSGECSGFHPAYTCQDRFWRENEGALFYAAKVAAQPYVSAQGPTVSGITVARARGQFASFTAKADDDAYGRAGVGRPAAQNIAAAEIYLDKAPWAGGTPQALDVRGTGPTVEIGGVVPTTDLAKRLAYVRAKDAAGNWGPFTTTWLPAR
ncbi:M14 family zinc carboxypeptidase [Allokutzneria sp. NRRL B-24872]|uniref:M14 family zinc carboxypeptidase n=1 Tax=Allokutzneria sp. NRRL B-24872 TaxID=1137961 RepID=UPI000A3A236D|nr:M14 family zinc carboxypeptidase [Allokutzneria sp. NRRL B-24872]